MLGKPVRDRRAERHEATRAEILDAAWEQARSNGLAAISLRDLARTVGMQPPSLYSYFDSKHAIYDAMFAEGAQQFLDGQVGLPADEPLAALKAVARYYVEFCAADAARYQLLFQRTIPGFEPSPESFEISQRSLAHLGAHLASLGVTDERALDLLTALGTGLAAQQIANDPGGDRWIGLVDEAMEMYHAHVTSTRATKRHTRRAPARPATGRRAR